MSYIIHNNEFLASTHMNLKSGEVVEIAPFFSFDHNDEIILWNLFDAKVSNAEKWDKKSMYSHLFLEYVYTKKGVKHFVIFNPSTKDKEKICEELQMIRDFKNGNL